MQHSPLKDRIVKFEDEMCVHKGSAQVIKNTPIRPCSYRHWTDVHMRDAICAVTERGVSLSEASEVHGVPRSTLSDHVRGRVQTGTKSGRPTILSENEEKHLVDFLLKSSRIGLGRTRQEVFALVERMLVARDSSHQSVTLGWWEKFQKRHPKLALRTTATLSISRASASSTKCLNEYFDLLESVLNESGLVDHPSLIFNMDETGFPLDPPALKTIHEKGSKNPISLSCGSKQQVTVVACVSACGQAMPPLIIWKRKTMSPEMAKGELYGTMYGFSKNGWMQGKLFDSWFRKHFLRYAPASRPLLLLMDGHSSHYSPNTTKLAKKNRVILLAFPPNTTHLTQPLDKGVFGPFKCHWKKICHDFAVSHPGCVVNYYNFCELLSKAWIESMTVTNITSGFKTIGIYPVSREALLSSLPSNKPCNDPFVQPKVLYTPFKTVPGDSLYRSDECPHVTTQIPEKRSVFDGILNQATPVIIQKRKRIKPSAGSVLTSIAFRGMSSNPTPSKGL